MAISGLQGEITADTTPVTRGSGRQKWHDKYSHLGTGPIPVDPFVSQAQFELERERILKKFGSTSGGLNKFRTRAIISSKI